MALPLLPMKAPSEILKFDNPHIRYPHMASTKFDGFRLLALPGPQGMQFLSPALKPFPNVNMHLRWLDFWKKLESQKLCADGEVWSPDLTFQQLQSIIRSRFEPIPDSVGYYVFDILTEDEWNNINPVPAYHVRHYQRVQYIKSPGVVPVVQTVIESASHAQAMFEAAINSNQEGIILRSPHYGYKHNRCTKADNGMWKFKQFNTHDAVIIGVEQRCTLDPAYERTTNAVGQLERVHKQEAYIPDQAVGAFIVQWGDTEFKVTPGRGFTYADRQRWWQEHQADPRRFIGKAIEFKYMPHGTKDKPRIGSLVRFRPDKDNELFPLCPNCGLNHHEPIPMCSCACCTIHYGKRDEYA